MLLCNNIPVEFGNHILSSRILKRSFEDVKCFLCKLENFFPRSIICISAVEVH